MLHEIELQILGILKFLFKGVFQISGDGISARFGGNFESFEIRVLNFIANFSLN